MLFLGLAVAAAWLALAHGHSYIYDRPICTGLGDRVGTMLSLAALARLENATVVYLWCEDVTPVLSRIRGGVPSWVGFNYSLSEFRGRFRLPSEIQLVSELSAWRHLPAVQWWDMPLPAEMGSDALPHTAWLTMRMGKHARPIINVFQEAYREVTRPLAVESETPYVVFHLRGPDQNTYWTEDHEQRENFCTAQVVRAMWRVPIRIHVVSNNVEWAREMMGSRGGAFDVNGSASAYDDFALLLSASAIIQHAWGGWSSYSAVPALVSGAPMMNTFDIHKPYHRFHHFERQLGLPVNFYDCGRIEAFMQAVLARQAPVSEASVAGSSVAGSSVAGSSGVGGHEHLVSAELKDSGLAALTRWAQAHIYANQFIPDCAARRFMVSDGFESGFGSEMYAIGAVLGYALEHNHTLVLSGKACSHFTAGGCDSVLAPISNCGAQTGAARVDLWRGHQLQFMVPSVFRNRLRHEYPLMTDKEMRYWWRGQSAAFVSRFNRKTVEKVRQLRRTDMPMPAGTISAHIRRGDKQLEMRLVAPERYVDAALELIAGNPQTFAAHTLFLSGDDIAETAKMAATRAPQLRVMHHPGVHHMRGGHDRSRWLKQSAGQRQTVFYEHLMQLTMALEADAWIGTRESNWNSLIDHLRCVWVDKCLQPYVEVGDGGMS